MYVLKSWPSCFNPLTEALSVNITVTSSKASVPTKSDLFIYIVIYSVRNEKLIAFDIPLSYA